MDRKLRSSRGETLIEVLCATLVAVLSVALLFAGITASAGIDRRARQTDRDHYAALTQAEEQTTPAAQAELTVENPTLGTDKKVEIDLYGGEGMYSYTRRPEAAP